MLVIIALSNGDPEENVEMMFYTVDLNNDGVITAEVNCLFCFVFNTKFNTTFCFEGIPNCYQRHISACK